LGWNVISREEMVPLRYTETSLGIATDIASAEIVALCHSDRSIAVVVEDKYLEVQVVDGDGAEFLKVLNESPVSFDEDSAFAS
jgi:hypothetical protein